MDLILIYGSEAVGKLTTAETLAKKTGYKLFHNHLSIDVAKAFFSYGIEAFNELSLEVRMLAFEHAAKADVAGVIFTWAYSHPDCAPQLEKIEKIINSHGGKLHLVYLHCSQAELETRVLKSDRIARGKVSTIEHLHLQQKRKNHMAMPGRESLVIDNTGLSAEQTAEVIAGHFGIEVHA